MDIGLLKLRISWSFGDSKAHLGLGGYQEPTADSKKLEHGWRTSYAGRPYFFGLGLEDGHVPIFWLHRTLEKVLVVESLIVALEPAFSPDVSRATQLWAAIQLALRICIHIYVCIYICTCIHVYICIFTHIHIYIYMYIYIYIYI